MRILPRSQNYSRESCGCVSRKIAQDQYLRRTSTLAAFTLVEVVVALAIFSFALMAIVGLFFVGIDTNKESSDQIQAANFASMLISTRRALPTSSINNFALPPLNVAYSSNGTYLTNNAGVAADGTVTGTRAYNLYYQAGTNSVTGTHLAQVHLMLWWPIASAMPINNPGNRYELTTQIALP
jgi:uncharacterized protein (TIGR02598 family)